MATEDTKKAVRILPFSRKEGGIENVVMEIPSKS